MLLRSGFVNTAPPSLVQGWWLAWSALTKVEQAVCLNIVLLPLWWISGLYRYMPALLLMGALWGVKWKLKAPNWAVGWLLAFSGYQIFGTALYDLLTVGEIDSGGVFKSALFWLPLAGLLWYIQSYKIRVRLTVVAWAFTISVLQMLLFWLVVFGIFSEPRYNYPRTIYSLLSGNASDRYEAGEGLVNYLIPYFYHMQAFAGLKRWSFFFPYPELLALFSGFICLIALQLKSRLWRYGLFAGALFLVLISGTRSVWIVLPLVAGVQILFTVSKIKGPAIISLLLATLSFSLLVLPPVTEALSDTLDQTVQATENFRADSTKTRLLVYARTLETIPDQLLFGHWEAGPVVLPGWVLGRVGTHSFILGTLLYRCGLVGTLLFIGFWTALGSWLWQTRYDRPLCAFMTLGLFTLVAPVMDFGMALAWLPVLLTTTLTDA